MCPSTRFNAPHLLLMLEFVVLNILPLTGQAPLTPRALTPIPLGPIIPRGWLKSQLGAQKAGLAGRGWLGVGLHVNRSWPGANVTGPENEAPHITAWLSAPGDFNGTGPGNFHDGGGYKLAESYVYWLNGAIPLAVALQDDGLLDQIRYQLEFILDASDAQDGWLGPLTPGTPYPNPWSTFRFATCLTQYIEATGDERAVRALWRFAPVLDAQLNHTHLGYTDWSAARAQEMTGAYQWLMDNYASNATSTQVKGALSLMSTLDKQGFDWIGWIGNEPPNVFNASIWGGQRHWFPRSYLESQEEEPMWHQGVNLMMALSSWGYRFRSTGNRSLLSAARAGWDKVFRYHGVPVGVTTGDDSIGATLPYIGIETCLVVDMMNSAAEMWLTSSDAYYADRLEIAAFNALPGEFFNGSMWALNGGMSINMVDAMDPPPTCEGGTGQCSGMHCFGMPYECCASNHGQGWPKLLARQFAITPATNDSGFGIVCSQYGPSELGSLSLPDGNVVGITVDTEYPFSEKIHFMVSAKQAFPFSVRIPGWCKNASVTTTPALNTHTALQPGLYSIKLPTGNSTVTLELPMEIRVERTKPYLLTSPDCDTNGSMYGRKQCFPGLNLTHDAQAVNIFRGPLLYALPLPYSHDSGNSSCENCTGQQAGRAYDDGPDLLPRGQGHGQNNYLVRNGPWQYALRIDDDQQHGMTFVQRSVPEPPAGQGPWALDLVPGGIRARVQLLPPGTWGLLNSSAEYTNQSWCHTPFVERNITWCGQLVPHGYKDGECKAGATSISHYAAGWADLPPSSPVPGVTSLVEERLLLPFGATELRLAELPTTTASTSLHSSDDGQERRRQAFKTDDVKHLKTDEVVAAPVSVGLSTRAGALFGGVGGTSAGGGTRLLYDYSDSGKQFQEHQQLTVPLDSNLDNVRFDGVGGDSGGGGGSRLLLDYTNSTRSHLLDLLFLPFFGASLHAIKVEIGCDGDTTQGSEQSHMHTEDDHSTTAFDRGYEIWLMSEARQRNPDIHLSGLEWGVPDWVLNHDDKSTSNASCCKNMKNNFWSEKNQKYLLAWMTGLRKFKGLELNSIALGRNEHGYNASFIVSTRKAMDAAGFHNVKIIAADDSRGTIVHLLNDMLCEDGWDRCSGPGAQSSPELRDAIDIIGVHTVGRINGVPVSNVSKARMAAMHKPFWNTEQHFGLPGPNPRSCREWATAADLAITLNRLHVQENMTGILLWTPIYSWYEWLWFSGKGIFVANTPWSGHFELPPTIWAIAHTTQFAQPGWQYINGGSGMLCASHTCDTTNCKGNGKSSPPCGSGSYVSYLSPDKADISIVIETMYSKWFKGAVPTNNTRWIFDGSTAPFGDQEISFSLQGDLRSITSLALWTTNRTHQFVQREDVPVSTEGVATVTVPPNHLFTLTTTTGQRKGKGDAVIPDPQPFSSYLPLRYDFEGLAIDSLPKYWSDMDGAFAIALEEGGPSQNQVLRQHMPVRSTASGSILGSVIGDLSWSSYTISARGRTLQNASVSPEHQGLQLTSHAGKALDGQLHIMSGLRPGDVITGGFGYRFSVWFNQPARGVSWYLEARSSTKSLELAKGHNLWFAGSWLNLSLSVLIVGNLAPIVAAYADDELLANVTAPAWGFRSGAASIGCSTGIAEFDDISIVSNAK